MLSAPSRTASAVPAWLKAFARDSTEHEKRVRTCWPSESNPRLHTDMAEERPAVRRKVTTDITHSVDPQPTSTYRQSPTSQTLRPGFNRPPSRTRYDSPSAEQPVSAVKARVNIASIAGTPSTRTPTRASVSTPTPSDQSPNVTTRRVKSPTPAVTPSISQRVTAKASPATTPTPRTNPPTIARVRSAGANTSTPRASPTPTATSSGQVYRQASVPVPGKSALSKQASSASASGSSSEIATSPSSNSSIGLSARSPPSEVETRPRARVNVTRGSLPANRTSDETSIWLDVGSSRSSDVGVSSSGTTLEVPRPTHTRRNSANHLQLDAEALPSFEPGSFEDRIHVPVQVPSAVPPHLRSPTTHISAPNSPHLDGVRGGHPMQKSLTPDLKAIKLSLPKSSGGYMTYHPPPLPLPPSSPNLRCAPLPDVDMYTGDDGIALVPGLTLDGTATAATPESASHSELVSSEDDEIEAGVAAEREVANEAKVNRKVEDLEISNGSLLALNQSLEAANAQYRMEIRRLRRLTRVGSSGGLVTPERRAHQRAQAQQSDSEGEETEDESESDDGLALDRHAEAEVVLDRLVALVDVMRTRAGRSLEERGYSAGIRVLGPGEEARS